MLILYLVLILYLFENINPILIIIINNGIIADKIIIKDKNNKQKKE